MSSLPPILARDRRRYTSWTVAAYASLMFLGAVVMGALR